jgi:hypothetical protein
MLWRSVCRSRDDLPPLTRGPSEHHGEERHRDEAQQRKPLHNAVLKERPHYLERLYEGFAYDRRGEEMPYQKSISDPVPVVAHVDGQLSIRYVRKSMETARQKLGVP